MVSLASKTNEFVIERVEKKSRPNGGFFKYTNKTKFDLSKYGIFNIVDKNNYKHNCLYNAFYYTNLPKHKLEMLKLYIRNRYVPKCLLSEIAEELEIEIKLYYLNPSNRVISESYGSTIYGEDFYEIGLIDEHYFIYDKTEFTSYCIKNYDLIKDERDCNMITCKLENGFKRQKRYINSFELVKLLLENQDQCLTPITLCPEILSSQFYDKIKHFDTLEYSCKNCKLQEKKEKKENNIYKIFFDFETITEDIHIPYLVRYETEDFIQKDFYGDNLVYDMLNSLPENKNIMLIAHNANYDCRFLLKYLTHDKPIIKGNRFLYLKAVFYNDKNNEINITIKDSYKLISMPLKSFGKSFDLKVNKEVMPYKLYTKDNLDKRNVLIDDALSILDKDDKQQFINNIDNWNCRYNNIYFDIIKYSSEYCKLDCNVLHLGYNKFRDWMLEYTKLDIDHYITIQSLNSDYKLNFGCYENVYMLSGVPQQFISHCVVGGRCMTCENKMYHVKTKIADFDACSLYPSAMARMDGYLCGKPKILTNLSYEFLKSVDGYFIRIKILRINIFRKFPLISKIDDNGVRQFTNDMINEIVYIDKYGLEDLIKYQNIEFEIIDGYYFDEGRNDRIKDIIKTFYDLRLNLKKTKNPAEKVIKLFLNNLYGKTILKPIETETVIVPPSRIENYISYNYNFIQSYVKVNNKYFVKKIKSILNHFNYVHCGVEILSMSKRIMNEVMTLGEDLNLNMYYQDTDSIHIDYNDVDTLSNNFKHIYNRDLIGNYLGNFHIDFDLKDAVGEIYAIESYFIAKKVYLDVLESKNMNDEIINGYHVRMKSVPESCVYYTANKNKISIIDIYKQFYNNESLCFDLTENGNNCGFKYEGWDTVRNYNDNEFSRTLQFNNYNKKEIIN